MLILELIGGKRRGCGKACQWEVGWMEMFAGSSQQSERLPAAISTHAEDRLSANSIQFRRRQMANMLSPYITDTLRRNESPTCHLLDEYTDIFNANTLSQYPDSEINKETTAAFSSTEPTSFILLCFF